jgi:hypothetical protein
VLPSFSSKNTLFHQTYSVIFSSNEQSEEHVFDIFKVRLGLGSNSVSFCYFCLFFSHFTSVLRQLSMFLILYSIVDGATVKANNFLSSTTLSLCCPLWPHDIFL